jgi:thymidylate synthase (FAD)
MRTTSSEPTKANLAQTQDEITLKSDIDVKLIQFVGSDRMVCAAARVSTSGLAAQETDLEPRLINYLMKHRHGTPFEHGSMTFFVHAPIFVWREWHRHRVMSYNEESGRYKVLEPTFYIPHRDRPMLKVDKWKPGRPKFLYLEDTQSYESLVSNLEEAYKSAYRKYLENLELQLDPGLARDCLPVGIYSGCWVTCNPRSLMHFLSLRTSDSGASYPLFEIEAAAKKCEAIFSRLFPITHEAFVQNGRISP